jgi:hypothetical protein
MWSSSACVAKAARKIAETVTKTFEAIFKSVPPVRTESPGNPPLPANGVMPHRVLDESAIKLTLRPHQCRNRSIPLSTRGSPRYAFVLSGLRCFSVLARRREILGFRSNLLYDFRILEGVPMKNFVRFLAFVSLLLLSFPLRHLQTARADDPPAAGKEVVLKAADISPKLFPERVYFRGQTAPVQLRNTAGVHFADDFYVLAGMVDSSGYSTAIKEKYQAYLLNEVTLEIAGQTLKPGAYGVGFLNGGKFVVMDLGANDVLQAASQRDAEMKRPIPLQVVASATAGSYRLYAGRDYVEFRRTP